MTSKSLKTQKKQAEKGKQGLVASYIGIAIGIVAVVGLALGRDWWDIQSVSRFAGNSWWDGLGVIAYFLVLLALVILIPQGLKESKKVENVHSCLGCWLNFLFCMVAGALIASLGVVAYAEENHLTFTSHGFACWLAGGVALVVLYMFMIVHSVAAVRDLPNLVSLAGLLLSLMAMIVGDRVVYSKPVYFLILLGLALSSVGLLKWRVLGTGRGRKWFADVALVVWRQHLAAMMFQEKQLERVQSLEDAAKARDWDGAVKCELKRYMKYRETSLYHSWLSELLPAGIASAALTVLMWAADMSDVMRKLGVNLLLVLLVVFVVGLYLAARKQYYVYLECCLRCIEEENDLKQIVKTKSDREN